MPGNVLEWTFDWYGHYPGGSVKDPARRRRGHYRTARGGSWRTDLRHFRSAAPSVGSEARVTTRLVFEWALTRVGSDQKD